MEVLVMGGFISVEVISLSDTRLCNKSHRRTAKQD
jgi:hypothetical protein